MSKLLWVGLGNPGAEYHFTRHNIGALILSWMADEFNASWSLEPRFRAKIATINGFSSELTLMLPQTYMNNSGEAVGAFVNFFRLPLSNITVWHDELDLPLGVFKGKSGGGTNGHNGLKSIVSHVNSNDFNRVRLGIGRPKDINIAVKDFVLAKFLDSEIAIFKAKWDQLKLELPDLLKTGLSQLEL